EAASLARFALQLEPAAERERELPRDRQAESGAAAVARPERPEDPLLLIRCDPRPGVADRHRHLTVTPGEREIDAAARRRPAERVRDEVRDDLEHPVAVSHEHRALPQLELVVDVARPRLLSERVVRTLAESPHVHLLAQEGEAARVELREVEDVAHEALEPLPLLGDHLERPLARVLALHDALSQRRDMP